MNVLRSLRFPFRGGIVWLAILMGVLALAAGIGAGSMQFAATVGVPLYVAQKVINILMTAINIWTVVSIIGVITGVGAINVGLLTLAKYLAKRYGAQYAVAW